MVRYTTRMADVLSIVQWKYRVVITWSKGWYHRILPQMVSNIKIVNTPPWGRHTTHSQGVCGKTLTMYKGFIKHRRNSMVLKPVPHPLPQMVCNIILSTH